MNAERQKDATLSKTERRVNKWYRIAQTDRDTLVDWFNNEFPPEINLTIKEHAALQLQFENPSLGLKAMGKIFQLSGETVRHQLLDAARKIKYQNPQNH
jgi:hypothetical protein